MPRRNTEGRRKPGAYHVYNRARNRQMLFRDDDDRREFLALLARFSAMHAGAVEVIAYCPMGSHFHLILWQRRAGEMGRFMASLVNAYTRYYHRRHGTEGSLFPGPYRARRLNNPKAFKWAVVYVHDNHRDGVAYRFSSHDPFIDELERPSWLAADAALRVFGGKDAYAAYVKAIGAR